MTELRPARYQINIRPIGPTPLATTTHQSYTNIPFSNLQFERFINKVGGCRFDVPLRHPMFMKDASANIHPLYAGYHEVSVVRIPFSGLPQTVFCGPLVGTTASSKEQNVNCSCDSLETYFYWMGIDSPVTVSAGTTNTALISSLRALYGIAGTDEPGSIVYTSVVHGTPIAVGTWGKNLYASDTLTIGDILDEFVNLNTIGYDWYVDPHTKNLHFWTPRKNNVIDFVLTEERIRSWTAQRYGSVYRNNYYVIGNADYTATFTETLANRGDWGRRTLLVKDQQLKDSNSVIWFLNAERQKRQNLVAGGLGPGSPPFQLFMTVDGLHFPYYDTNFFSVGDSINMRLQDTVFFNIPNALPFRVVGFQVSVDSEGGETIILYFNDAAEAG